jgi:nicotinamidase-related amidase
VRPNPSILVVHTLGLKSVASHFVITEHRMRTALLLIDIQNDYFSGGAMELVGADSASTRAAALLGAFRERALPVIHIQHVSARPMATFFRPNTHGVGIHSSVLPTPGETVITKGFPNSFRETSLLEVLRAGEVTKLVVAGMMTHMCVDTTVRAATDLGFACTVAHDACATRDLTFKSQTVPASAVHAAYMAALDGSFGNVLSTADVSAMLPLPNEA